VQPELPVPKQWSTPIAAVIIGWILAVAAALWWLTSNTGTDRVFVGLVFLALVAASGYATVCRPRLRADSGGIAVRGLRGTQRWAWPQIKVTVERHQRLGLHTELLQVEVLGDAGDLILLSRLDLGEAPQDVAESLTALRS
jgi:hypothetical protein